MFQNAFFLDATWCLPLIKVYEFVPCAKLGINVRSKDGFLVVTYVEPDSVADEDAKIEVGDVIQSIYDISLRNGTKRQLVNMVAACKDMPVVLTVIKCIGRDNKIYPPLHRTLDDLGFSSHHLMVKHRQRIEELTFSFTEPPRNSSTSAYGAVQDNDSLRALYLGCLELTGSGSVNKLGNCILEVLDQNRDKTAVTLHIGSLGLMVIYEETEQILFCRGYPEISACGRRLDRPKIFAVIVGEKACFNSKNFVCYVFEAESELLVKSVIEVVAKGFHRTHWAV
ncbi:unnamed protein product [Soboliphyme baturini]|uniref:PDZ domain-containing protein n=1 Tax=Soboliphyme baturini TaxID=241478 RepID=A0A3P8BWG2_9BILA|nr:unnamed protein product [Soboliphyme baturini]